MKLIMEVIPKIRCFLQRRSWKAYQSAQCRNQEACRNAQRRGLACHTSRHSAPNRSQQDINPRRPLFSWHYLNPLNWSYRAIRVFTAAFFMIMLPVYIFIGLQPALPAEAANYPVLEINSIGLKTPVAPLELTDHQLIAPTTIAGSYSQAANKTLIIGHSSTVFSKLHRTELNDQFSYAGQAYQIIDIVTLAKPDVNMAKILAPTDTDTIIIMTCAGEPLPNQDATHRLLITAVAI